MLSVQSIHSGDGEVQGEGGADDGNVQKPEAADDKEGEGHVAKPEGKIHETCNTSDMLHCMFCVVSLDPGTASLCPFLISCRSDGGRTWCCGRTGGGGGGQKVALFPLARTGGRRYVL